MNPSVDKDREEMARQLRHVAHNIRSHQRLALGDTEAGICERAAEVLDSSSCATQVSGLVTLERQLRQYVDVPFPQYKPKVRTIGQVELERWHQIAKAALSAVPESGQINAAGQEAESAMPVKGAREGVTEAAQHAAPAPAAPFTPPPGWEAPTPRTDEAEEYNCDARVWVVSPEFARQLERELAEEREEVQRLTQMVANAANELASRSASARIKIPTDTMEQEFQSHYRRGYEAGKAAALSSTPAPSASEERDPWKEAIIDGLIVAHIYSKADEEDPRKALNKLLAWEQSVALDPRVSSAAEALVEQGRQSALSSTTRIMGYDLGRLGGDQTVVTCRVVDRIEECATPNLCLLAGKCQRSATEGIK